MGFPARRRDAPAIPAVSPRAAWHDRNPMVYQGGYYGWEVAPHGITQRVSFTVPTGKKAILHSGQLHMTRITAATTLGKAESYWSFAGVSLLFGELMKNAVGDSVNTTLSMGALLVAGTELLLYTYDTSTGGTIDYRDFITLTYFDA